MSEALIDLMDDLHKMQTLLDFILKGLAALSTASAQKNLQLSEYEAYQVAECGREMLDQMVKRVEEAFKAEFCKPK